MPLGDKLANSYLVHLAWAANYKYLVALVIDSDSPFPIHRSLGRQLQPTSSAALLLLVLFAWSRYGWTEMFPSLEHVAFHLLSQQVLG